MSTLRAALFGLLSGCSAAHVRPADVDAAPDVDAAADAAVGVACPGAILEVHVPDGGCASFAVPAGTRALPLGRLLCTPDPSNPDRPIAGYRIRVIGSEHLDWVVTVDRNPPCALDDGTCYTGFATLDPRDGCGPDRCVIETPQPVRMRAPRDAPPLPSVAASPGGAMLSWSGTF